MSIVRAQESVSEYVVQLLDVFEYNDSTKSWKEKFNKE